VRLALGIRRANGWFSVVAQGMVKPNLKVYRCPMLHIEPDTVVKGHIATVGTVLLSGRLEGNICCTRLEIGEHGYLLGKVTAEHVIISGQVIGEVRGMLVEVMRNAIVEADVYHAQLSLDEDAVMSGVSQRIDRLDVPAAMRDVQQVIADEEAAFSVLHRDFAKREADDATNRSSEFEQLRAILTKTH
jgi:cytoskeletal protein CcmA (bactofilin family)